MHAVATDKAAAYPPALVQRVPAAVYVTGELEQQRIERDHGRLKSRLRSMRWFKTDRPANLFCRAHSFVRNLQDGFWRCGLVLGDPRLPRAPRLVLAWQELTQALQMVVNGVWEQGHRPF